MLDNITNYYFWDLYITNSLAKKIIDLYIK